MLTSALRGPSYAAATRRSAVTMNPIICSPRFFSDFTPAPSPTANVKSTTEVDTVYQQPTNEIQGPAMETPGPTENSAASPEHMTASHISEREQKQMLMAYEVKIKELMAYEMKIKELRAELMAIPDAPIGATTGYNLFLQHCHQSSVTTGKYESKTVLDMWKALSDAEQQEFKKQASDIRQLRAAEYDEWAETVGFMGIHKINRDRLLSGKKKLRIPLARPVHKSLGI
ncbi:hypothetical protein BKA62DRAFT_705494, partial [Auriculariales sp. MPI-PUGE-AT-0066]